MKRQASVLDWAKAGLDPKVFDDNNKLREEHKEIILDKLSGVLEDTGLSNYDSWIDKIRLIGSMTTYRYTTATDLDIHTIVNIDNLRDSAFGNDVTYDEVIDVLNQALRTLNGDLLVLPETNHRVEYYFEVYYVKDGEKEFITYAVAKDGEYDLLNDSWTIPPREIASDWDAEEVYSSVVDEAKELASELDVNIGTVKREITDIDLLDESLESFKDSPQQASFFKNKIQEKLNTIEEEIENMVDVGDEAHREKTEDYSQEGQGDEESEIKFKYLQRYAYVWLYKKLEDLLEGGIEQEELSEIKQLVKEYKMSSLLKQATSVGKGSAYFKVYLDYYDYEYDDKVKQILASGGSDEERAEQLAVRVSELLLEKAYDEDEISIQEISITNDDVMVEYNDLYKLIEQYDEDKAGDEEDRRESGKEGSLKIKSGLINRITHLKYVYGTDSFLARDAAETEQNIGETETVMNHLPDDIIECAMENSGKWVNVEKFIKARKKTKGEDGFISDEDQDRVNEMYSTEGIPDEVLLEIANTYGAEYSTALETLNSWLRRGSSKDEAIEKALEGAEGVDDYKLVELMNKYLLGATGSVESESQLGAEETLGYVGTPITTDPPDMVTVEGSLKRKSGLRFNSETFEVSLRGPERIDKIVNDIQKYVSPVGDWEINPEEVNDFIDTLNAWKEDGWIEVDVPTDPTEIIPLMESAHPFSQLGNKKDSIKRRASKGDVYNSVEEFREAFFQGDAGLSDYITVGGVDYMQVEYSLEDAVHPKGNKGSRWITYADEDTLKNEIYIDVLEETMEEQDAFIDWGAKFGKEADSAYDVMKGQAGDRLIIRWKIADSGGTMSSHFSSIDEFLDSIKKRGREMEWYQVGNGEKVYSNTTAKGSLKRTAVTKDNRLVAEEFVKKNKDVDATDPNSLLKALVDWLRDNNYKHDEKDLDQLLGAVMSIQTGDDGEVIEEETTTTEVKEEEVPAAPVPGEPVKEAAPPERSMNVPTEPSKEKKGSLEKKAEKRKYLIKYQTEDGRWIVADTSDDIHIAIDVANKIQKKNGEPAIVVDIHSRKKIYRTAQQEEDEEEDKSWEEQLRDYLKEAVDYYSKLSWIPDQSELLNYVCDVVEDASGAEVDEETAKSISKILWGEDDVDEREDVDEMGEYKRERDSKEIDDKASSEWEQSEKEELVNDELDDENEKEDKEAYEAEASKLKGMRTASIDEVLDGEPINIIGKWQIFKVSNETVKVSREDLSLNLRIKGDVSTYKDFYSRIKEDARMTTLGNVLMGNEFVILGAPKNIYKVIGFRGDILVTERNGKLSKFDMKKGSNAKVIVIGQESELELTPRLKRKIREHAEGSMYKMNAPSADVYAFSLTTDGEWQGGWDWKNQLVDKYAQWIYDLETKEFYRNTLSEASMEAEGQIDPNIPPQPTADCPDGFELVTEADSTQHWRCISNPDVKIETPLF